MYDILEIYILLWLIPPNISNFWRIVQWQVHGGVDIYIVYIMYLYTIYIEYLLFRNHIAFRAEKSLGAIAWGKSEADVFIMRDACNLLPDDRTKPKVLRNFINNILTQILFGEFNWLVFKVKNLCFVWGGFLPLMSHIYFCHKSIKLKFKPDFWTTNLPFEFVVNLRRGIWSKNWY